MEELSKIINYQGSFLIILASVVAVAALIFLLRRIRRLGKKTDIEFTIEIPEKGTYTYIVKKQNAANKDLVRILKRLTETLDQEQKKSGQERSNKESGLAMLEILFGGVPALIALSFVATIIFLIVNDRTVPDILINSLTTIIGYYFGMGASVAISQRKQLTPEDLQGLLQNQ